MYRDVETLSACMAMCLDTRTHSYCIVLTSNCEIRSINLAIMNARNLLYSYKIRYIDILLSLFWWMHLLCRRICHICANMQLFFSCLRFPARRCLFAHMGWGWNHRPSKPKPKPCWPRLSAEPVHSGHRLMFNYNSNLVLELNHTTERRGGILKDIQIAVLVFCRVHYCSEKALWAMRWVGPGLPAWVRGAFIWSQARHGNLH